MLRRGLCSCGIKDWVAGMMGDPEGSSLYPVRGQSWGKWCSEDIGLAIGTPVSALLRGGEGVPGESPAFLDGSLRKKHVTWALTPLVSVTPPSLPPKVPGLEFCR